MKSGPAGGMMVLGSAFGITLFLNGRARFAPLFIRGLDAEYIQPHL
jgi:hypothetical protein